MEKWLILHIKAWLMVKEVKMLEREALKRTIIMEDLRKKAIHIMFLSEKENKLK